MESWQQTDSLFAQLDALTDGDAMRVLGAAALAVDGERRANRFMAGALPLDALTAAALFMVGGEPMTTAGKIVTGVGAAASVAHFGSIASRTRTLARREREWADAGQHQVALYLAAARCELLALLPNSRTRTAMGLLRVAMYAGLDGNEQLREVVVGRAQRTIAGLPDRAQLRLMKEAHRLSEGLESVPDPAERALGRSALVHAFPNAPGGQLGEIAIEAAVDFSTAAQAEWSRQADMLIFVHDDDDDVIDVDTLENWEEEVEHDLVQQAISDSASLATSGLVMIWSHDGADVAAAWARKLIREDRIGTGVVLHAYESMMHINDDPALESFRQALADQDPNRTAALEFLGITDVAGRDGLDR